MGFVVLIIMIIIKPLYISWFSTVLAAVLVINGEYSSFAVCNSREAAFCHPLNEARAEGIYCSFACRLRVLPHSVKDIRRLTRFAEDAIVVLSISRRVVVDLVVIPMLR